MKRFYLILVSFLLLTHVQAQLTVGGGQTPAQLVQNNLLGSGVTVSNITYTGNNVAIGTFNGTNSNIGLNSGIILMTGNINLAPGPNNIGSAGTDLLTPGDPNLDAISNASTEDAAILEFDFVPTSDTVQFRYVFASEEYPEFVNQGYNDVFAFFISGPGIPGVKNMALIPGTTTPVTIDNVNANLNSQYYVNNSTGNSVQFDGFTKVLTATSPVQCGQTYHLKIAIADAGDGIYDSGVFLETGSLNAIGGVNITTDVDLGGNDTILYEGCGTATIEIERLGATTSPFSVSYTVTGTATMGTDFNALSGVVNFTPGQSTQFITIQAPDDGFNDPNETIILTFSYTICSQTTTKVVTIVVGEAQPLNVDIGPDLQFTCQDAGNNVLIQSTVTGGISPYFYTWNTGATTSNLNVPAGGNVSYFVTVTDACGAAPASDTVHFSVINAIPIDLTVSNDTIVCPGSTIPLTVAASGGNGGIQILWSTAETATTIQVTPPANPTVYYVNAIDNCGIQAEDSVIVRLYSADADFVYFQTDTASGIIQFTDSSSGNIAQWFWDFGDSSYSTLQNPEHDYLQPGYYEVTLTITTVEGCQSTITYTIPVYTETFIYFPNAFTPNFNALNDVWNMVGQGFANYNLRIFNRWGECIWFTDNYKQGWPGTNQAGTQPVPLGVYVYRLDILNGNLEPEVYRGRITLIR